MNPMIQRKIHHLLKDAGDSRDHRYLRELRLPFDLSKPILVTEKVDGTTVQGRKEDGEFAVYKRFDNFKPGDPRKHSASEADRYRLERLRRDDPAAKWIFAAADHHREAFSLLPEDLWIFFEALGEKIGARYKNPVLAPTIRVFDTGDGVVFSHFDITREFARFYALPLVAAHRQCFGNLDALVENLRSARSCDQQLEHYPLEGWVLRQKDQDLREMVAKIRVKDLERLAT